MDKRIGYGLSFTDAMSLLERTVRNTIEIPTTIHVNTGKNLFWAELREEGWRVYIPKDSEFKENGETQSLEETASE